MRILLLVILFMFPGGLIGQSTFNLFYDHVGGIDVSYFAVEDTLNNHYYVTSKSRAGGVDSLIIHKLDYTGKLLDSLSYSDSGFYWLPENILLLEDTVLVFTGSVYNPSTTDYNAFVGWYYTTTNQFTVRYYPYGFGIEGAKKIKRLFDGGYIVVAFSQTFANNDAQNYIFKIDNAGNKAWALIYGDSTRNEEPYDVLQLADSSLLILSRRVYPDNDNILFLKLSPHGYLIWENEIVTPYPRIGVTMIATTSKNILVGGIAETVDPRGFPFIESFDTAGNSNWYRIYENIRGQFWDSDKVGDSTFVFAGAVDKGNTGGEVQGYIVNVRPNGDPYWQRTISPYGDGSDPSNDYFYGVLATSDGGILGTGFTGEGLVSNTQDAWIMKLDSQGLCDTPTCFPWLVTVLPNPEKAELKVWPNPASSYLQILLPEPTGTLHLFNLQGNQLITKAAYGRRPHLPVQELPAGLYFLEWEADGVVRDTRKVVIQR